MGGAPARKRGKSCRLPQAATILTPVARVAYRFDAYAHVCGFLGYMAAVHGAPDLAVLLVDRVRGGSFLTAGNGLRCVREGAFVDRHAAISW